MDNSDAVPDKYGATTTAESDGPQDRSDTSDCSTEHQGRRAARGASAPDRVVDPDAVAGQNPAELSDAQLRALYETHDFTGVEIARLLEVGDSAVYERLYQCEWYEGELARRLRHQAHPDPHDESDLRADGGSNAVVDNLEEQGPLPRSELPYGVGVEEKAQGVATFDPSLSNNGNGAGHTKRVYYLIGEHSLEAVIRAWFDANPDLVDQPERQVTLAIHGMGASWREAWKSLRVEYFAERTQPANAGGTADLNQQLRETDPDDLVTDGGQPPATCTNCGTEFPPDGACPAGPGHDFVAFDGGQPLTTQPADTSPTDERVSVLLKYASELRTAADRLETYASALQTGDKYPVMAHAAAEHDLNGLPTGDEFAQDWREVGADD